MPRKTAEAQLKWRQSRQIQGVRSQLVAALNCCDDGAYVSVDIRTARNLIEVCDQAIHMKTEWVPLTGWKS
jgi:hypothetical protein